MAKYCSELGMQVDLKLAVEAAILEVVGKKAFRSVGKTVKAALYSGLISEADAEELLIKAAKEAIKRKPSTAFEILVAVAEEGISKAGLAQICRTVEQALNELREEDAKILVLQLGLKEISSLRKTLKGRFLRW